MRALTLLILVVAAFFCASCDSSDPSGIEGPEFLGAWERVDANTASDRRTYNRVIELTDAMSGYVFEPRGYLTVRLYQYAGGDFPSLVNRYGSWEQGRDGDLTLEYQDAGNSVTDRLIILSLDDGEMSCRVVRVD